jgi:hypothetical protein
VEHREKVRVDRVPVPEVDHEPSLPEPQREIHATDDHRSTF